MSRRSWRVGSRSRSQRRRGSPSAAAATTGSRGSTVHTSRSARQGSMPSWFPLGGSLGGSQAASGSASWSVSARIPSTIPRRWVPGKGKRRLAATPPSSIASRSPSQRLVGQVLTTTSTGVKGSGGERRSSVPSSSARTSARLLRWRVSTADGLLLSLRPPMPPANGSQPWPRGQRIALSRRGGNDGTLGPSTFSVRPVSGQ